MRVVGILIRFNQANAQIKSFYLEFNDFFAIFSFRFKAPEFDSFRSFVFLFGENKYPKEQNFPRFHGFRILSLSKDPKYAPSQLHLLF